MMIFKFFKFPQSKWLIVKALMEGFVEKKPKLISWIVYFYNVFNTTKPLSLSKHFHQTLWMSIIIEILTYDYVRHEAALMDIYKFVIVKVFTIAVLVVLYHCLWDFFNWNILMFSLMWQTGQVIKKNVLVGSRYRNWDLN